MKCSIARHRGRRRLPSPKLVVIATAAHLMLSGFGGSAPDPTQICFVVDDNCSNLQGASITVTEMVINDDGTKTPDRVSMGAAMQITRRAIEGDEVNFGFWSKNAHRKNTYAEMYQWKYGVVPTPAQEAAITDAQARQWFNERYTTSNLFTTEPPINVHALVDSPTLACYEYTRGSQGNIYHFVELVGRIKFPNGTTCKIDLGNWDKNAGPGTNPNVRKAKVIRPCAACG